MSLEQNIIKAINGDSRAFRDLYDQYVDRIYKTAFRILNNEETAKDITQETFMDSFLNLASLRDHKKFYGWTKRICINKCLKFINHKIDFIALSSHNEIAISESEDWYSSIPWEDLKTEIEQLPAGSQMIFKLHAIEDLKHREIAEILDITVGTSKSQYSYAIRLLKKALSKKIYNEF